MFDLPHEMNRKRTGTSQPGLPMRRSMMYFGTLGNMRLPVLRRRVRSGGKQSGPAAMRPLGLRGLNS